MTAYGLTIGLHVVTAILGVGQVTGLVVVASASPRSGSVAPETWKGLRRLARGATWSLVLMLITGVLLEYLAGGAHGEAWWFRISFLLFVACGAVLGMIQGTLRRGEGAREGALLGGVLIRGGVVVGMVAVIAALMQLKPW